MKKAKIRQEKFICDLLQILPPESKLAYQSFLKELRQGKRLEGERPILKLPGYFDYQLSTGDLVVFQRHKLNFFWGVNTQIVIKNLISSDSHDSWRMAELLKSQERRTLQANSVLSKKTFRGWVDDAQRVVFFGGVIKEFFF